MSKKNHERADDSMCITATDKCLSLIKSFPVLKFRCGFIIKKEVILFIYFCGIDKFRIILDRIDIRN